MTAAIVIAFLLVGLIVLLALIADPDDQTKHHTTPGFPADWRNRH